MADLNISAVTLAVWASSGTTPAPADDIAQIASLAGADLPADYVLFLETHGFATWDDGTDAYYDTPAGRRDIFFMLTPDLVKNSVDLVPDGYLPIAQDYSGHGFVTLQTTPPAGSVWHVEDSDVPTLIAPDFASFLATLAPAEDTPKTERWQGTPVTDAATGFTIAQETRDAWAAYGTGATPEPADELAAIEQTLGQDLPEALRSFLTTYGYVTFFGDAIATFALPEGAGQAQEDVSVIYSTAVLPRALPLDPGAHLPFASTATDTGSLTIGLQGADEGRIFWQADAKALPVPVADDLRAFLADLYRERPVHE